MILRQNNYLKRMPINCTVALNDIDQSDFHDIDQKITGWAFEIHNTHGRLLNEKAYQNALLKQSMQNDLSCTKEVEIKVTHENFSKSFFLDLLMHSSIIYEIKASLGISASNEAQLLNYLLLSNSRHGKIINFGTASVTHRFISTSLSHDARQNYNINKTQWRDLTDYCPSIRATVNNLLADWGSHLSVNLYKEALLHLLDGQQNFTTEVDLVINENLVGTQTVSLIDKGTALHISSYNERATLLSNTPSALSEEHKAQPYPMGKLQWA